MRECRDNVQSGISKYGFAVYESNERKCDHCFCPDGYGCPCTFVYRGKTTAQKFCDWIYPVHDGNCPGQYKRPGNVSGTKGRSAGRLRGVKLGDLFIYPSENRKEKLRYALLYQTDFLLRTAHHVPDTSICGLLHPPCWKQLDFYCSKFAVSGNFCICFLLCGVESCFRNPGGSQNKRLFICTAAGYIFICRADIERTGISGRILRNYFYNSGFDIIRKETRERESGIEVCCKMM